MIYDGEEDQGVYDYGIKGLLGRHSSLRASVVVATSLWRRFIQRTDGEKGQEGEGVAVEE